MPTTHKRQHRGGTQEQIRIGRTPPRGQTGGARKDRGRQVKGGERQRGGHQNAVRKEKNHGPPQERQREERYQGERTASQCGNEKTQGRQRRVGWTDGGGVTSSSGDEGLIEKMAHRRNNKCKRGRVPYYSGDPDPTFRSAGSGTQPADL